ncbi:MAG: CvpA family protein [Bacteroidales bacterium]|nr:CvpA family protein [Bacteroidales bacterium]
MNILDIIILILLVIFTIQGFRKGLVAELSSLLALILGVYVAFFFSSVTADFLHEFFGIESKYLKLIAFVLTLVLVIVAVAAIGKVVEKIINTLMLGFFNRLTGAVFGAIKGMLILSLILMLLNYLEIGESLISKERQQNSRLYDEVESFAPYIFRRFKVEENFQEYNPWKDDEKTEEKSNVVT